MADETKNALIQRPGTGLAGTGPHTSPVIARMTRDVLARAQAGGVSLARFRIGEYLLREPDYRQIRRWAESLGMTPEALLAQLAWCRLELFREDVEPFEFTIEDGAIVSLVWNFDRLPFCPAPWEPGLLVRALGLVFRYLGRRPGPVTPLRPVLPLLQTLICRDLGLESLDLSKAPGLTNLNCGGNILTKLDLSPVPGLTKLNCMANDLTELDLSFVPGLSVFSCSDNQLTELDLSPVPGLTELRCWGNQLTDLDLWPVPGLTVLDCDANPLTELDLSPVPALTDLWCDENTQVLNAPANLSIHRL